MSKISSIYQTDSIVDSMTIADNLVLDKTQDYIKVEVEVEDCIEVEVPNSFN